MPSRVQTLGPGDPIQTLDTIRPAPDYSVASISGKRISILREIIVMFKINFG